nr:hypothetical protein CFP56_62713 [Quercus suber]
MTAKGQTSYKARMPTTPATPAKLRPMAAVGIDAAKPPEGVDEVLDPLGLDEEPPLVVVRGLPEPARPPDGAPVARAVPFMPRPGGRTPVPMLPMKPPVAMGVEPVATTVTAEEDLGWRVRVYWPMITGMRFDLRV